MMGVGRVGGPNEADDASLGGHEGGIDNGETDLEAGEMVDPGRWGVFHFVHQKEGQNISERCL